MRNGTPEELEEHAREFVRRPFGLVVSGVDRAAVQLAGRPWSPDRFGVAVNVEVVVRRDEQQHRAPDLPACGTVGFLIRAIDAQAGAVVLTHAVDDSWIAESGPHVRVVVLSHLVR